ncbi:MAG: hypothetical protein ABIH41_01550 [Nanoarchaeota archaeon]
MNQPVFVKIDEYEDILNILDVLRANIAKTKDTIDKLQEMRAQEEQTIKTWHLHLDDVTKKVEEINKTLFQP